MVEFFNINSLRNNHEEILEGVSGEKIDILWRNPEDFRPANAEDFRPANPEDFRPANSEDFRPANPEDFPPGSPEYFPPGNPKICSWFQKESGADSKRNLEPIADEI